MKDGTILLRHQGCEVSPVIQEILAASGDERWRIRRHTSVAWLLLVAEGGEWTDRFAENGSQ